MSLVGLVLGSLVGLSLGMTGGGGAVFAVPLLVFGMGLAPSQAVGVSLLTVGATSLVGFFDRWRMSQVEIKTGLLFAVAGMITAPLGSWLAAQLPAALLLVAFAGLMLSIAWRMWRKAAAAENQPLLVLAEEEPGPTCRRDPQGELTITSRCAALLASLGLLTGVLAGLFGVGGGFIIVPALVLAAGMNIQRAVGTSLLVIALVSASGVAAHAWSGEPLPLVAATPFTLGSIAGLFAGALIGKRVRAEVLQRVFAVAIVAVALFVLVRALGD